MGNVRYKMVESHSGRANLCHIFDREEIEIKAMDNGLEISGTTASGRVLAITAIVPLAYADYDYDKYEFSSCLGHEMDNDEYYAEVNTRDKMIFRLIEDGFAFSTTMIFVEDADEKPSEYFITTLGAVCDVRDNQFFGVNSPIISAALKSNKGK